MILQIDTTERQKIYLSLIEKDLEQCFEFETQSQSDDLLIAIAGILNKAQKDLRDLKTILVNAGPGSYTGTRIGVTTANTLAWSLNIPIYSYNHPNYQKVLTRVSKSTSKVFTKQVLPIYPK